MSLQSSDSLVLSKAIQDFLSLKYAEGLVDRTVDSYDRLLQKYFKYAGDVGVYPSRTFWQPSVINRSSKAAFCSVVALGTSRR